MKEVSRKIYALDFVSAQGFQGNVIFLDDRVARLAAPLRDARGTRIEEDKAVSFFEYGNVGVPGNENVAGEKRGEILLVPQMPVGDEAAPASGEEHQVVTRAGELEKHLVNLAVAVAANREDADLSRVDQLRGFLGIVSFGDSVARAVVQVVAAEDEILGLFLLEGAHCALEGGGRTVDI